MTAEFLPDEFKEKAMIVAKAGLNQPQLYKAILVLIDEVSQSLVAAIDDDLRKRNIKLKDVVSDGMPIEDELEVAEAIRRLVLTGELPKEALPLIDADIAKLKAKMS